MLLAIFIFLVLFMLLSVNLNISLKSMNDTIKIYGRLGIISFVIPHQKIIMSLSGENKLVNFLKNKGPKVNGKSLALNILSHSVIDRIYIAKFSNEEIYSNPISNGLYIIAASTIRGLLHSRTKLVYDENIGLIYDKHYENIDYLFEAHISIINIIWASIVTILGVRK